MTDTQTIGEQLADIQSFNAGMIQVHHDNKQRSLKTAIDLIQKELNQLHAEAFDLECKLEDLSTRIQDLSMAKIKLEWMVDE